MRIFPVQIRSICQRKPADTDAEVCFQLERAAKEAGVVSHGGFCAWVAQLAHESARFTRFIETASGEAYEGRRKLGNTEPGDGPRYKGRGPIQLTGRSNYRAAGEALRLPLVEKPWLVEQLDVGFRVAAWYWRVRGCNTEDFEEQTRRINGGLNGYEDRLRLLARAKNTLREGA